MLVINHNVFGTWSIHEFIARFSILDTGWYVNYYKSIDAGATDENGTWFLGDKCRFYVYSKSSSAHVLELDCSNRLIVNDVEVGPLVINDGKAVQLNNI